MRYYLARYWPLLVICLLVAAFSLIKSYAPVYSLPPKQVLITFDDGPDPEYTPQVLAILKANDIHAIFFVVGQAAAAHQQLLRQIADEGHTIGNHTYTHQVISNQPASWLEREIAATNKIILETTGKKSSYFRPPLGKYGLREALLLKRLGQTVVLWDLGLEKSAIKDPDQLVYNLIHRLPNQQQPLVLLLHDGDPQQRHDRQSTVKALPRMITALKDRGYAFVDPANPSGRMMLASFASAKPKVGIY